MSDQDWLDRIPENLTECFEALNSLVNKEELKDFRSSSEDDGTVSAHFGLGMWMRNNWGLWGTSTLKSWFNSLGIYHGDDMSSIILTSWHRHLNDKPLLVEDQVAHYRSYWEMVRPEVNNGVL